MRFESLLVLKERYSGCSILKKKILTFRLYTYINQNKLIRPKKAIDKQNCEESKAFALVVT